jgi:hypothetical protein
MLTAERAEALAAEWFASIVSVPDPLSLASLGRRPCRATAPGCSPAAAPDLLASVGGCPSSAGGNPEHVVAVVSWPRGREGAGG